MKDCGKATVIAGLAVWMAAVRAPAATLPVGPGRIYAKPSQAAAAAHSGDIIEIDAGLYVGDVATWTAHNLTIRGVGGRAHLRADGQNAQGKGIWVITGTNTTVENIEFSGATVPDKNGAGIRQEGSGLTVRNCYFHDNEEGILTGAGAQSEILIEYSEFAYNGYGDGQSHNMYIGNVGKFTLRYCYSHHAKIGHLVKTRADANYILFNRLMDEMTGTVSYEVNIPQGGLSYVIGNLIEKGPASENHARIIDYSSEGKKNATQALYVANNTIVNDYGGAPTFVWFDSSAPSPTGRVVNNVFVGSGTPTNGISAVVFTNNLTLNGAQLVSRASYDYHLIPLSSAIDKGIAPGVFSGFDLTPLYEYVHPATNQPRPVVGPLDIGAYECSDRDRDAMDDNWEIRYFGSINNAPPTSTVSDILGPGVTNSSGFYLIRVVRPS